MTLWRETIDNNCLWTPETTESDEDTPESAEEDNKESEEENPVSEDEECNEKKSGTNATACGCG